MADLMGALGAAMLADSGIQELVGDRAYMAGHVPQSPTMPYLVYQLISEVPHRDQDGLEIWEAIYQFDCVARDTEENVATEALADAVEAWLDEFRGSMGGVTIRLATLDDERDEAISPTDGSARGPNIVQQDYTIYYVP